MNNTSRVINTRPNTKISPEDILSTNVYIPSFKNTKELTNIEKANFRDYIETDRKNNQIETAIKKNKKRNDYDYFADVSGKFNGTTVIEKQKKNIIKIETPSIIDIDTKNRDKNAYPFPSQFTIPLGKTFYNIKSIELVSTAIPNTDQTITNTPEQILNNKISWVNKEDEDLGIYLNRSVSSIGDYLYVTITNHRLDTQTRNGKFYVKISKSLTTPPVDGTRFAEIFDTNTLKIPFIGGINATSTLDIDVGVPNYTVDLTPGNYTASSIATEIQKQMNLVKRRYGTEENNYHYFTVNVNLDTDVMVFRSYITKQLSGSPLTVISGSGTVTVNSISHGHKAGDFVLIIGAKTTGGLTPSVLNGLFTIDILNSDSFTYEVNERASETANGGGTTCKTGTPSEFKLIFDTANSKVANNIGFPSEDSSEKLGTSSTPLTTKALRITDAQIAGDYTTFTSVGHGLVGSNIYVVVSISVGSFPVLTTNVPHNLNDTENAYIYYPWSIPVLDGFYPITATGPTTFRLDTISIISSGMGTGQLKHGGDTIKLIDFKSVPTINGKVYIVENATLDTFQIRQELTQIQADNIPNTLVGTTQIYVNHQNHGFNSITSIAPDTVTTALITTQVPHGLSGNRFENATKESTVLNTVDITTLTPHLLSTSDKVLISNSVGGADIGGTYVIQVITATIFRIFFVGGTGIGSCDINTGNTVIFSETNSTPSLSSNNLGIVKFYVEYVNPTTFRIRTGFPITVVGTFGILGRDNKIALHRVTASENGGSTLGGIPLIAINSHFLNIDKIIDVDNYMVRVREHSTFTTSSGGNNTVITSSRNGFRKFQSNTFSGEEEGTLYKSISLEGENYLYLVSPGLQTVFSPGNESVGEIFSRIVLNEPPGNMLFDSFVSVPKLFNPPLNSLRDISFEMKRSDGILFNFNDIDYSMSLKITEIVDRIIDTEISSATGTSDLY